MDFVDYYKLLGVEKNATTKDIKSAYRKLARKFHPDLNPNDKDAKKKFQEINEANEVLSDPEKRKKYDKFGKDWNTSAQFEQQQQQRQQQYSQGRQSGRSSSGSFSDFSDFFKSMFGEASASGSGRRHIKYRGEDFNAELELDLADAYKTHQQTLSVNDKKIRITVPAGIENGQTIKIPGHGGKGINGGPDGDLYLTFMIRDNPSFKRRGHDLFTMLELDLYTAVLGGEITIDTLSGKVRLKVKPETQNGAKVKLKGKGFPVYRKEGQYGDLFITYTIKIPTNLTERQKDLFKQLSEQ